MKTRKLMLYFATVLASFSLGGSVLAADVFTMSDQEITEMFDGLPDSQEVIAFPDGAYMANIDGSSSFSEEIINQNGGKLESVGELKEEYKDKEFVSSVSSTPSGSVALTRSAKPSAASYTLPSGAYYKSQPFSGSGWRFAGYLFKPASGTGDYLSWKSNGDDGRVGTWNQAWSTYKGKIQGIAIYQSSSRKYILTDYTNLHQGMTYYSYNPKSGSYYVVANY